MTENTASGRRCAGDFCDAAMEMGGIGVTYRFAVLGLTDRNPGKVISFAALINTVDPGGPSHNVLLPGDRLLKIDDEPVIIKDPADMFTVSARMVGPVGTEVTVTVERTYLHGQIGNRTRIIRRAALQQPSPNSAPVHVGALKCRGCPIGDEQKWRCGDCPTPIFRAQTEGTSTAPTFSRSNPDANVEFTSARANLNALKQAEAEGRVADRERFRVEMENANKRYREALAALDTGIRQRPGH